MIPQKQFKQDLLNALSNIIKAYHFDIVDTDHHHIQLAAKDFALEIAFAREGLDLSYFDLRSRPNRHDYSLGHYLVQVRHAPLTPPYVHDGQDNYLIGKWRHEMAWLIPTLETHAQDILSGDRRWQATYHFALTDAPDGRYGEALRLIERRGQ